MTAENEVFDDSLAKHLTMLLPVRLDPKTNYTFLYDKDGHLMKTYLNDNEDRAINYEYGLRKELLSIAGYYPEYVKEIFEYYPDRYIKYIYRLTADNIYYKYAEDYKTVSCLKFKPVKSGNKRGIKAEELLNQMYLKSWEDGTFTIQTIDAKTAKETEKYTYEGFHLMKKEMQDGSSVSYAYDDFDNISSITEKTASGTTLNYTFEYQYDDKDNWTSRIVSLDNKQLLSTKRNISYYN